MRTGPVTTSVPSSNFVYQRPPTNGSIMDSRIAALPMLWLFGHQRLMPAVNTSKARSGVASTITLLCTGAILMVRFIVSFTFFFLAMFVSVPLPA